MSEDDKQLLDSWFTLLKQAKKTCLVSKIGVKRILYEMHDGREMIEEWKAVGVETKDLLGRYWKKKSITGKEFGWETEIGESVIHLQNIQEGKAASVPLLIRESNSNPTVSSKCTSKCYEWRIRNLPGPGDNYQVSCDIPSNSIVISTKNRKYYKKLLITDLQRFRLKMDPSCLSSSFSNRTLVINYKKEARVMELEKRIWVDIISPLKEETPNPILNPGILNPKSTNSGAIAKSRETANHTQNQNPTSGMNINPNGCTHA